MFNIVSEEGEENFIQENDYNWILDPLDGTYNYLRGVPIYCISLALWKGYNPVLGVVFDLTKNDIYHAISGKAAYKNNKQIKVSKVSCYHDAVLCTGFPVNYLYTKNSQIK